MIISKVLIDWDQLPENMQNDSVRKYYDILYNKRYSLLFKRLFDILMSIFALIILSPLFVLIAILIKIDSKGSVIFCQERVTQYGKKFCIYKFRTMFFNTENKGAQITIKGDKRITKVGKVLRKCRLDEIPQLFNIIIGDMSFVGTRPEVVKYVEQYTEEMMATLLLPAGVTSEASIQYKNEAKLLEVNDNLDQMYIEKILPDKMDYNLKSILNFSLLREMKIIFKTIVMVFKQD
ncbi:MULTISPECIES: sugar transferase [Bacillus]|uniref:sugar transferase n=1 Tax=Bacillus TaxID=1386 RepID=UPI0002E9C4D4|nr:MULTISPECIES: sugar transferase [Bacillus]